MEHQGKFFLLDAYALIFRAYYAFINRPIRNSKGLNTSAVYGFVNSLEEVLRKEKPTHIAVAFDPPTPTFRDALFKTYKANREETPSDIKLAIPFIKSILAAYQIPVLEVDGFEADDVIGTIAKIARQQNLLVYMMTPDKDFAQLVEDGIYMYKPRKGGNESEIWGIEEVRQSFNISDPLQVVDVLALWGDASDNVPGAPGIGEKTAKKLISEYGSVENLISQADTLKGKLKDCIRDHSEQILLSKKLVTIDVHVPVSFHLSEFEVKPILKEELGKIFKELEFRTLTERIIGSPASKNIQGTLFDLPETTDRPIEVEHFETFRQENVEYTLISSDRDFFEIYPTLLNAKEICIDTETTGLNVLQCDIIGIALSVEEKKAWYIDMVNQNITKTKIFDKLIQILNNKDVMKIGHNIKYDLQVLKRCGVEMVQPFFDTMIAHYLLYPEGKHKLDVVAENFLHYKMISIEQLIGVKGPNQLNMKDIDVIKCKDYACEDADITFRLFKKLKPELLKRDLLSLAEDIDMPLIEVLADMETCGFNLDINSLREYESSLVKEIREVEQEIYKLSGEIFNIGSPKQLGVILFEKLKISSGARMTRTKQYSTSEDVLQQIRTSHPIVDLVLTYRSLTKLASTYVTVLPKLVDSNTLRIHSSFNQTIASTGRLSSVNPNLQNIPIREERGREIRKSFIPADTDHILLSADYSQIELRLMAHMSADEQMIDAFLEGTDIHRSTAARIYKVEEEEVTREMRSNAKTANFGIIYGISSFGLSQRLSISRSDAKNLIENYFATFPLVKEYMNNSIQKAKDQGYVTTLYGRRRYLPDINSGNAVVRGVAERNAINSPIQGTAADIIKLAMINIYRELKQAGYRSRMILQVHDELVFDVYKPELDEVKAMVKQKMENVISLRVPLLVELGTGVNWLEAH